MRGYLRSIWIIPGATLLIVGAALSWFAYDEHENLLEQEFRVLESNDRIAAAQIAALLRGIEQLMIHVAMEQATYTTAEQAETDTHLRDEIRLFPEIRSLVVTNAQGVVEYAAISRLKGFDVSQRDYFTAHVARPLQPNFYVSQPYTTALGRDNSIVFSMALVEPAGRFRGVVAVGVNPQFFESLLAQVVPDGAGALAVLFNARGEVMYQMPRSPKFETLDLPDALRVRQRADGPGPGTRTRHIGTLQRSGDTHMLAIHHLGMGGLGVAVSRHASPVFAPWWRNVVLRMVVFFLACAIALGLTWQVRRREKDLDRVNAQLSADIAARKAAEASLRHGEFALQNLADALQVSHQRLRALAAESEGRLESERKQIARDVHDELGQVLAALRMDISLVRMRWGPLDANLVDKMVSMKALVDRAIAGVRNVATHLHPMVLDAGLVPAIEWLCTGFTENTAIACVFRAQHGDVAIGEAPAVVVFRIVQEALTNITRHAKATEVRVAIERCDNHLRVEVADNGQGFDVAATHRSRSFGLLGMRERALAIHGTIHVDSTPGHGTVVVVTVPIHTDTKETP